MLGNGMFAMFIHTF